MQKRMVNLGLNSYPIYVERGLLDHVGEYINLNRRVLIVSDVGVPSNYIERIAVQITSPSYKIVPAGESSKSIDTWASLMTELVANNFTRTDAVIALGGGVVGDLSGFAAACYMRGIDFINIPTTLLSQIDSSIGGKTALDFGGIKNIIGAFYQPTAVFIDPDTLKTLDSRQMGCGMAEAIKMAATFDSTFFEFLENENGFENLEHVILSCLDIKKNVVEKDEKESGLRKVLNFGHTLGHAIESQEEYLHGEAVGIGMLYFSGKDAQKRIKTVLNKYHLPMKTNLSEEQLYESVLHDKKMDQDEISVVCCPTIGNFELKKLPVEQIRDFIRRNQ